MTKKAIETLRNGLEDSHWYSDDDEKIFNELVIKAKAWDELSESIRECNKEIEVKDGLNAMFRTSKKGQIVQRYIDCFESGGPYA